MSFNCQTRKQPRSKGLGDGRRRDPENEPAPANGLLGLNGTKKMSGGPQRKPENVPA